MSFFRRIFQDRKQRQVLLPLYRAVVARGRAPFWYRKGRVPDTIDGRFDMIAAMMALTLIRLEEEGEAGREPAVLLTELFVDDMDESLRQVGIGDYVVGKHVGRLMGALGGRLGAFREGRAAGDLSQAVRRNIYREAPPDEGLPAQVAERLQAFDARLGETPLADILAGRLPAA